MAAQFRCKFTFFQLQNSSVEYSVAIAWRVHCDEFNYITNMVETILVSGIKYCRYR